MKNFIYATIGDVEGEESEEFELVIGSTIFSNLKNYYTYGGKWSFKVFIFRQ